LIAKCQGHSYEILDPTRLAELADRLA